MLLFKISDSIEDQLYIQSSLYMCFSDVAEVFSSSNEIHTVPESLVTFFMNGNQEFYILFYKHREVASFDIFVHG